MLWCARACVDSSSSAEVFSCVSSHQPPEHVTLRCGIHCRSTSSRPLTSQHHTGGRDYREMERGRLREGKEKVMQVRGKEGQEEPRLWQNNRGQVINSRAHECLLFTLVSMRQEIYFRLIAAGLTAATRGL